VNNNQVNINAYDSLDDSYTEKFKKLTPKVIREVLLIASLYDAFLLEEEGRLIDLMIQSYSQKGYGFIPVISRVNSFEEAKLKLEEHPFQLVIAVLRKNDQHQKHLLQDIKSNHPDLPLIGLAFHSEDLLPFTGNDKTLMVDQVFLWQGEGKILLGIIQYVEDKINALHDIQLLNVPCLLLVEDSVPFYSSYFHVIDEALWSQMSASFRDDLPYMSRILRLKARPKILLANTFEEGLEYYKQYKHHLIGIITDLCYDRAGKKDPTAGIDFAQMLHLSFPDLPIIIQSSENNAHTLIKNIGAGYLDKNSKTLIRDFKTVLNKYFGFGELVFKSLDGSEIARTSTIEGLLSIVDTLPPDALRKQYDGNYLKRWFWVRAEFELADLLYCDDLLEEKNPIRFRQKTKDLIQLYLRKSKMGSLVPFSRKSSYNYWHISKLGEGSIGGKARGLVFMDKVLQNFHYEEKYPQLQVSIPRSLILGTDIFDEFIQKNNLAPACLKEDSDMRIAHAFLNAELPPTVIGDLRDFIMNTRKPLAVRSSSLLEDALYQPFAGVYATKMVPNNHLEASQRFQNLTDAIKLVYASTFFRQAKNYIESTQHRIEEEKMAIILQEVVGRNWNNHYYPLISGVARSYNFYPTGYSKPEDGVAHLAFGLGKTIVDGGTSIRYTPKYPKNILQFNSVHDMLHNSQKQFYSINMKPIFSKATAEEDEFMLQLSLGDAELDGTLTHIASTYSYQEDRVYENTHIKGPRIINFAPILKYDIFPLSPLLDDLLQLCEASMGTPVEIEFAIDFDSPKLQEIFFGFLQVRPMVSAASFQEIQLDSFDQKDALCVSAQVLGNGIRNDLQHIVFVQPDKFDPSKTREIAQEIEKINLWMKENHFPYLLVGPGRWGSSDPWLGIPVQWGQISEARAIVEANLENMLVDPSQGSHFFQNITSLGIGYFTVPFNSTSSFFDWDWLNQQTSLQEFNFIRCISLASPILIQMDGKRGRGVILKKTGEEKRL
jgi:hypothetical protein